MLADPISHKVNNVATNHPRTGIGSEQNTYQVADGTSVIRVGGSSTSKRNRKFASSTVTKVAADPLTAVLSTVNATVTISVSYHPYGFTQAQLKQQVLDAADFWTASTGANTDKILGGER